MNNRKNPVYIINPNTKAIVGKESDYYHSWILERNRERLSIHKPEKIIEHNCLIYGFSMSLRRKSAMEILQSSSKLPIPISPEYGYYMFPTASPRKKDCVWIAFHHIQFYEERDNKTYIRFTDGTDLYVNISINAFDQQYKRMCQVIIRLNHGNLFGRSNFRSNGLV